MSQIIATPTARVLHAMRERKWLVWEALYEFVDNSFGEQRGNASTVWITWAPSERVMTVRDDGLGMNDVIDLFVLGKGSAAGRGDIGLYGVGGSEAGLWLADTEKVETLRNGLVAKARVNWAQCVAHEEFPVISNEWHRATAATCHANLRASRHGTLITLFLRDGLRVLPDFLRSHLARTFSAGLRSGRRIVWVQVANDTTETIIDLEPWNPGDFNDVIEGTVTLRKGLSARVVAGRVDNLSIADSRLAVNYLYRQIKETSEGFGRAIQGACGHIDLAPEWLTHLTTTKDDFREESRDLESELMAKVAELLKPLVDQLEKAKLEKIFHNVTLNLETKLNTGLAKLRRKPTGYGPSANPKPRQPSKADPAGVETPASAIVRIKRASDAEIEGLLCRVGLTDNTATGFVNEDHPLIVEALKSEPVNQRLLETVLVQALASEIVKRNALVQFGLVSDDDAAKLLERFNGEALDVVLYLIRTLTDGIVRDDERSTVAV